MSVSLPSREIYSLDVPEIERFSVEFRYNFFTPDESTADSGVMPAKLLKRGASEPDAAFVQRASTIYPRFAVINWKMPLISDPNAGLSDLLQRNNVFSSKVQNGSLISDNLDRIVTENQFSLNNFIGVCFHDSEVDDKIYNQVSGSYELNTLSEINDHNVSHFKAAQRLSALTPKHIKPHFLYRALANPTNAHNTRFFGPGGRRIFNEYFRNLKEVALNVQVNSKFFHDISNRSIRDPNSQFSTDMHEMQQFTKNLRDNALQQSSFRTQLVEADFKTFVPHVSARYVDPTGQTMSPPEIVGYVIDKVEIPASGPPRVLSPIIIENPKTSSVIDYEIKYGTTYVYSIRAIAWFSLMAFDDESGETALITALISSKQSSKVYIDTIETTAPPAPSDLNFTWDYERINPTTAQFDPVSGKPLLATGRPGSLMVHWTFPPNSQRDIKKFQVFRRRNINQPFELLKVYDFDDSLKKSPDSETPDPALVERLRSPCTFYWDDEFHVGDHNFHDPYANTNPDHEHHPYSSTYIYAVACIDAHGFTSNYSAQYEVWFDPFKNKLQKKLISHSGAPKPYPNLYLEADTFVDTIRTSGPHSKRMRLIFNPEYYYITDEKNRVTPVISTNRTGGKYKLQFVNVDNQKSAVADITIDDRTSSTTREPAKPPVRLGKKRSPNANR